MAEPAPRMPAGWVLVLSPPMAGRPERSQHSGQRSLPSSSCPLNEELGEWFPQGLPASLGDGPGRAVVEQTAYL